MNFNDYVIDKDDYDFFSSLPDDEKLLFLHDLICEEFYGAGSVELKESDDYDAEIFEINSLSELESKIYRIIESSIRTDLDFNIIFINDRIIINSDSAAFLEDAALTIMYDGYIITEQQLSLRQLSIFHQQRYCKVYKILGMTSKISLN